MRENTNHNLRVWYVVNVSISATTELFAPPAILDCTGLHDNCVGCRVGTTVFGCVLHQDLNVKRPTKNNFYDKKHTQTEASCCIGRSQIHQYATHWFRERIAEECLSVDTSVVGRIGVGGIS
jgi:hypothetical protein